MPDGFISMDPMYYAQQFAQGQATLRDTNAQASEREMSNQQNQRMMDIAAKFSNTQPAAQGAPNVTVGPWQDSSDPSVGGDTGAPAAAAAMQPPAPGDMALAAAKKLAAVGNMAIDGGMPAKGADLLAKASEIARQGQEANDAHFKTQTEAAAFAKNSYDLIGQVAGSAENQDEWTKAKQELAQNPGIDQTMVKNLPDVYSPRLARMVADHSVTAAQKMEAVQRMMTAKREQDSLDNTKAYQAQELSLRRQAQADREANAARDRKNGAVTDTQANQQARNMLMVKENGGTYPEMKDKDGNLLDPAKNKDPAFELRASTIADQAMEIYHNTPGLSMDQALERAYAANPRPSLFGDITRAVGDVARKIGGAPASSAPDGAPPPEAFKAHPGKALRGKDGTVWTLDANGNPKKVQ